MAYVNPREKIPVNQIFLEKANWRSHSFGIGKAMMVRSRTRLTRPTARNASFSCAQLPLIALFQLYANGWQIRKAIRMVAMV